MTLLITILNIVILSFLVEEIITNIFFTKGGKYRFSHPKQKKYSHLITFSSKHKLVFIRLFLLIILLPVIDYAFWPYISFYLESLKGYQWSLFFFILPIAYLWTEKRIVGGKWHLYNIIPIGISLLSLVLGLLIYFN